MASPCFSPPPQVARNIKHPANYSPSYSSSYNSDQLQIAWASKKEKIARLKGKIASTLLNESQEYLWTTYLNWKLN
jgi:hypothetical protein